MPCFEEPARQGPDAAPNQANPSSAIAADASITQDAKVQYLGKWQVTKAQYEELLQLASIVRDTDHTLLKQDATRAQIAGLCREALEARELFGVGPATVCVHSSEVGQCAVLLKGSGIGVCAVVGFPNGKSLSSVKAFEAQEAVKRGATEIDMVINVGALLGGEVDYVREDIRTVAEACHKSGVALKTIIECCNLNDAQKASACKLAEEAGADWVKTSTGKEKSGATPSDVALMHASTSLPVKAAGGMDGADDAQIMRENGASRFGASKVLRDAVSRAKEILGIEAEPAAKNPPGEKY